MPVARWVRSTRPGCLIGMQVHDAADKSKGSMAQLRVPGLTGVQLWVMMVPQVGGSAVAPSAA